MASRISSSWWSVEAPGNRGRPASISPRMQPRLHMSTPGVYLGQGGVELWGEPQRQRGGGEEVLLGGLGHWGHKKAQGPWRGRRAQGDLQGEVAAGWG